jgi:hypothetical protein
MEKGVPTMIAQAKIDSVKQYLEDEFPAFELTDTDDFDRMSWKFSVAKGATIHVVKFERRVWDVTSDIKKALRDMNLSKFMKDNEGKQVLVTIEGLTVL